MELIRGKNRGVEKTTEHCKMLNTLGGGSSGSDGAETKMQLEFRVVQDSKLQGKKENKYTMAVYQKMGDCDVNVEKNNIRIIRDGNS